MIEPHTAGRPGWKVSMALEEMGLPYQVGPVDLGKGDQRTPESSKICRNGRIPAMLEHCPEKRVDVDRLTRILDA